MKLLHRLGFYFGGFFIGLIFLMFFLSGKKTSCAYGPNARVLKNINTKTIVLSQNTIEFLEKNFLDSTSVFNVLKSGDVLFDQSKTKLDSCKIYTIKLKEFKITVANCDSLATVTNIWTEP